MQGCGNVGRRATLSPTLTSFVAAIFFFHLSVLHGVAVRVGSAVRGSTHDPWLVPATNEALVIVSNAVNKDITSSDNLLHLPTVNGEHCTGGAATMGEAIGAQTIDPEQVEVH